jgi:hypothetical protein
MTDLMRPCRLLQARQFLEPWPYFLGRENQMLSWPIVESESGRIYQVLFLLALSLSRVLLVHVDARRWFGTMLSAAG